MPQQPVPVGHASARAEREAAAVLVDHPVGAGQDHGATARRAYLAEESEQFHRVHGPRRLLEPTVHVPGARDTHAPGLGSVRRICAPGLGWSHWAGPKRASRAVRTLSLSTKTLKAWLRLRPFQLSQSGPSGQEPGSSRGCQPAFGIGPNGIAHLFSTGAGERGIEADDPRLRGLAHDVTLGHLGYSCRRPTRGENFGPLWA